MVKTIGQIILLICLGVGLSLCSEDKKKKKKDGDCDSKASTSPTASANPTPLPSASASVTPSASPTVALQLNGGSFELATSATFTEVSLIFANKSSVCMTATRPTGKYDCANYTLVMANLAEILNTLETASPPLSAVDWGKVSFWMIEKLDSAATGSPSPTNTPGVATPISAATSTPNADANPCY
jgi:hypothetical protein